MRLEEGLDPDFRAHMQRLERQLRLFQVISFLLFGTLALTTYLAVRPLLKENSNGVLRVRGLIIDDEQGHERLLLGAPIPQVAGRKRKDPMTGVLVLGENGADRVVLGALALGVQTRGVVRDRIGEATGLAVNDENGNERGGFGVESDRMVLGMDYPSGASEGIELGVGVPDQGVSIAIHDSTSLVRAALSQRNDSPALLYGINSRDKLTLNLGILRLSPFATKDAIIGANQEDFVKTLDSMKP